ncbi:MAG: response regulator [Deltaproteobacteria bacterium]|nr:response regulator [Deltaproteobacteria bacterium]
MDDSETLGFTSCRAVSSTPGSTRKVPSTVLIVDDDPDLLDVLARFLLRQGMLVLSARNGQQCLEKVRRNTTIDLIVLDVVMPGMDGLQVCAALRKIASARSIPIILLTARDDRKVRLAGRRLGVSEVLVKPVRGRELVACIQTQVKASRQARAVRQESASIAKRRSKTKGRKNGRALGRYASGTRQGKRKRRSLAHREETSHGKYKRRAVPAQSLKIAKSDHRRFVHSYT